MRAQNAQYAYDTVATHLGDKQRAGLSLREAIVSTAQRYGITLDQAIDAAASGTDVRAQRCPDALPEWLA